MSGCKHVWKVSKKVEAKCSLCGMLLSEAIRLRDEANAALAQKEETADEKYWRTYWENDWQKDVGYK